MEFKFKNRTNIISKMADLRNNPTTSMKTREELIEEDEEEVLQCFRYKLDRLKTKVIQAVNVFFENCEDDIIKSEFNEINQDADHKEVSEIKEEKESHVDNFLDEEFYEWFTLHLKPYITDAQQ